MTSSTPSPEREESGRMIGIRQAETDWFVAEWQFEAGYRWVRVDLHPNTEMWLGSAGWLPSVRFETMDAALAAIAELEPIVKRCWDLELARHDEHRALIDYIYKHSEARGPHGGCVWVQP